MKREYIISSYDATLEDKTTEVRYKIKYFGGNFDGLEEFYGIDLENPQTEIRIGYTKHKDSL